jgi:hypothetical protein
MIKRSYQYRCTVVTTEDYGDTPATGQYAEATLSVIADGSFWRDRAATIKIGVPVGTRPGALFRVTIEEMQE